MPQFEQFDTFLSQIFWLAVFFGILHSFLNRFLIPRVSAISESRSRHVQSDLDKAADHAARARELMSQAEARLETVRAEVQVKLNRKQLAEQEQSRRRLQELDQSLKFEERQARERLEHNVSRLQQELEPQLGELVAEITEKLIGKRLSQEKIESVIASHRSSQASPASGEAPLTKGENE